MHEKPIYSAAMPVYIKVKCRQSQYWIHWNHKGKRNDRKRTETESYLNGQILISETVLMEYKNFNCKMRLD